MSNVIKLTSRSNRPSLKVAGIGAVNTKEDEPDLLKKQLDDYYKTGFREGQEKARRDLEQDYSNKLIRKYQEVFNILQQYDENLLDLEKSFESLVIETAYEISKKIVQREIEDRTVINENVKAAINKIIGANEVRLKMNPADIEALSIDSKNMLNSSSFNKIKIEGDERIEKGGCLIETEIGNVDARISTQITELKRKLEESI
ncbi:MAG: flagellar assembly protein FliH [Ignavibacteria bacterium]|nr:MAG: flagellar assembly protein FliH [Ignavibacteria bacterium]KAF0160119.1 MAG: flagellar assembly protein FliH [Ignavibacteria bacterium]